MATPRLDASDTLIVTGGAGFIGCNFVRHALAQTPCRVVVLDKLTYAGCRESLADLEAEPRFRFVEGDIADPDLVARLFREEQPAAVLNFAAESHVDRSIDGPRAFVETNAVGTFELLEAAHQHLPERPPEERERFRFLHVSTDEVYGSLGAEGRFAEDTPYAPNSPYSATKAAADHLVRAYHKSFDLPVLITNCSNNYGAYQFPEKLIPLMILNAVEGKALPIYGDGAQVRDWLFVEDHCAALLLVLREGRCGRKYNVGGDSERTNVEIVDLLCTLLEQEWPAADNPALRERGVRSYAALKTFVEDRPGHDRRYAVDASRIRDELGWRPQHDLESGLRRTARWYLDHRDWCDLIGHRRERLGLGGGA